MSPAEFQALVKSLDTSSSLDEEAAWSQLKPLGPAVVPHLAAAFPRFKKWQGRASLVFHSIHYARKSEEAFQLGLAALSDKATVVRYRACGLLAYSLRNDALPALKPLLNHTDKKTAEDAAAAIDAIRHNNHHYFVDRNHTGRAFWQVNEGDGEA